MTYNKSTIIFFLVLTLLVSCKKESSNTVEQKKTEVDLSKVFRTPNTPEEKLFVENLGKVTDVFKEIYREKSNITLVNAAIFSKAYTDESVLLKDLIYPEQSWLNEVDKFKILAQKWNVSLVKFADAFWKAANKRNDPTFVKFLNDLNPSNTANRLENEEGQQVSVYFPYSEEYEYGGTGGPGYFEPITSLVTATADADEGWGSLPYFVDGVFQYHIQVIVNDDYVFENPTHIIGVNGIEIVTEPNGPPPPPPPPPGISRVYIGEGICKDQYDRLISFTGNGGGSEIKYCHLSAYLQPVNGHVTTFQDIASVDFSRYTIRKKNWKWVYIVWDDDWVPNDLEQILGIYEEDNTNTKTFNGNLSTTLKLDSMVSATGSIGYTVSVMSQDEIIRQLKISRNSYFTGAFQDNAHGFSNDATFLPLPFTHGWPAYDVHYWTKAGANVGWTWPYNTL